MNLAELAAEVPGAQVLARPETSIERIVTDSRTARPGDLFMAVRGHHVDSHQFVPELVSRGVVVGVESTGSVPPGAAAVRVPDGRLAVALMAAALDDHPARRLRIAGVTGTDGKTTVAHMLAHILESASIPTGLLTTVVVRDGPVERANPTGLTTQDAIQVQAHLRRMVESGFRAAVIEASSHALVQERVTGCEFDVAAITNVGRDHLEYHASWAAYVEAKARLIDLCAAAYAKGIPKTAVLNADDESFAPLSRHDIERRLTYSMSAEGAEVRALGLELSPAGSRFDLVAGDSRETVNLLVPARFNVANALCAAGAALALGLDVGEIAHGLSSFLGAAGRLEKVDLGQPFRIFIDYAHSASSLASVLRELRQSGEGRVIAVFGSTARSDHDRAGMGRAAARFADYFVITTDDPVDEDPAAIARQVELGAEDAPHDIVLDRAHAIKHALSLAQPGDTVLLAGKGHEKFMLREGRRRDPWDEHEAAETALKALGWDSPARRRPPS